MSTERIGLNGMTTENRQWYDSLLLERAVPAFVHQRWALRRPIPARGGNSIEFRRLEAIGVSTTALVEGTPPSATNVTVTAIAVTVQQYGQFTYHSEVLATQGKDPIVSEIMEAYGEAAGDALDQIVRNVIVAGTTVQFASTGTSRGDLGSGMRMSFAEIREAVSTLARNNAKTIVDNKYIVIHHSDTTRDLFADSDIVTTFQNAGERSGGNPLITGEIGDLYKSRFIETTNARIFSSEGLSGADVYATMFLGRQAYGVSEFNRHTLRSYIKPVGSGGTQDPLNQFGTVGWKASLAAVRLNEAFMVRVEHTTTRSNAS